MEFDLKGGIYIWSHSLREGNRIADFLVNHGLTLNGQCCVFYFIPDFLRNIVLADVSSTMFSSGF